MPAASLIAARKTDLKFNREIAPDDKMLTGNADAYFGFGFAALAYIQLAMMVAGIENPRRVLDLPCGHGRVLRMLKAGLPGAEITVCDLDRDAVDFCIKTFGAIPAYSSARPEDIELPGAFDVIWCGSLLTHLDAPMWTSFLRVFSGHLTPGGIVIFTVAGRHLIEEARAGERAYAITDVQELVATCDREGFAYQDYLHEQGYGITFTRPKWVCEELEKHEPLELLMYTERGWNRRQDAVVCRRVSV